MKSSREQFEEWFRPRKIAMQKKGVAEISIARLRRKMLEAWQASRAAIEIELPSKGDSADFFCEVYSCEMVHESLANCGIKVKS